MKKIYKLFATIALFSFSFCNTLIAQPPPPDPGTGDPLNPPAGAPIGDGLLILGILAALYAGKKIYELYLENKEDKLSHVENNNES